MSSEEPKIIEASVAGNLSFSAFGNATVILGPESYRRLAENTGFRIDTLEKVVRLGAVLTSVYRDSYLRDRIALKGGTAINLIADPIRRLSVDLDFNYIGSISREDMLKEKPEVTRALVKIGSDLSYSSDVRDAHGGTGISFRYRNSLGGQDQITVDLNWLLRVPIAPTQECELWQPEGVDRPRARLVSNEELIVGKLAALMDRSAARDVFDACFLPDLLNEPWPTVRLRKLFVLFTGSLDLPLWKYGPERVRLEQREYENHLVPVLGIYDIPLREELLEKAKGVVFPLLEITAAEREFIERLQVGEYDPAILFPDEPEFVLGIAQHPALLWKAHNAREHVKKNRA